MRRFDAYKCLGRFIGFEQGRKHVAVVEVGVDTNLTDELCGVGPSNLVVLQDA